MYFVVVMDRLSGKCEESRGRGHAAFRGLVAGGMPMFFPGLKNGLLGARYPASESRRSSTMAGRVFEDITIAVSCHSRFVCCEFRKCAFLWAGRSAGWRAEVFIDCTFDDCRLGMTVAEFAGFTRDAAILIRRPTRQEALELAARRYCEHSREAASRCLDPSFTGERQQLAEWVRAEYRRILDYTAAEIEAARGAVRARVLAYNEG